MFTSALVSAFLAVPLFLATASPTYSSCTKTPHTSPQVTWTTTRCAYCFPTGTHVNDTLWVNYNGTLAANGKPFDSSYTSDKPWPLGDPFAFVLGNGSVIPGYVEILVLA